jgi:hypothetical protein
LKRVNNQLKNIEKKGFLARRKNTFVKKKKRVSTRFCQINRILSQPGFVGFLPILIFYLTQTGPATKLTYRAGLDLITMVMVRIALPMDGFS